MESRVRKNTVKLVCSSGSKTPAHLEVLKFALQHLKVPPADLHSVYRDENENRFYLKFIDDAKFSSFMSGLEEAYMFPYDDGTTTRVHLEMASRIFRYVRIFSLPPEIEDKDIAQVLGQYGTIRQQVRERFAAAHGVNIYTGVRGVHMEVAKEIPPHVYIGHFRVRIFYDGLKNKCYLCKGEGHVKADCPRAASNGGGNEAHSSGSGGTSSSYANVTALGEAAKCEPPPSANVNQPNSTSTNATSDPPTIVSSPPKTAIEGGDNVGAEPVTAKDGDEAGSSQPQLTEHVNDEEMELDEKRAAQKRALISSSDDDTLAANEAPFVTVQQRKGKVDPKKGKTEPLPTAALEKRSVSKSQPTPASKTPLNTPKHTPKHTK